MTRKADSLKSTLIPIAASYLILCCFALKNQVTFLTFIFENFGLIMLLVLTLGLGYQLLFNRSNFLESVKAGLAKAEARKTTRHQWLHCCLTISSIIGIFTISYFSAYGMSQLTKNDTKLAASRFLTAVETLIGNRIEFFFLLFFFSLITILSAVLLLSHLKKMDDHRANDSISSKPETI